MRSTGSVDSRLCDSLPVHSLAIQCTLFIKSTEKNWLVSLHQDLSIPVGERVDSPLYSGWSEKERQLFVQPPVSFLERMLVIRVHLDDCDQRNGALRVVPGSHTMGDWTQAQRCAFVAI
jgi:ectoine hydroxylase-related dioxygenase (phytanoyl-CoA dioxygenase family)